MNCWANIFADARKSEGHAGDWQAALDQSQPSHLPQISQPRQGLGRRVKASIQENGLAMRTPPIVSPAFMSSLNKTLQPAACALATTTAS